LERQGQFSKGFLAPLKDKRKLGGNGRSLINQKRLTAGAENQIKHDKKKRGVKKEGLICLQAGRRIKNKPNR